MRDVESEFLGEPIARFLGDGVPPGAEFGKLLPRFVEHEVAMHHPRDADRIDMGKRLIVFGFVFPLQRGVAVPQSLLGVI